MYNLFEILDIFQIDIYLNNKQLENLQAVPRNSDIFLPFLSPKIVTFKMLLKVDPKLRA